MNIKKSRLHKIAAAATALCVAFTQVAIAAPAFSVPTHEVSLPDTLRLDQAMQISVPSAVATIDKLISGNSKTIFHIQTAHGQYQAEKQIEALLTHLEKNYGVETLLMEGASQPLNPEIINFFPEDRKSTLEAVDAFVRHSVVSGPEVFLLNSGKARGLGIEDEAAYEQNLQDFAAVISARDSSSQFLSDLEQGIERLAALYLSSEARSFLKQVERKETGDVPFDIYLQQLKLAAEKHAGINLTDASWQLLWPMLTRVFTIEKLEKKIDAAAFKKQGEDFLKAIKPSVSAEIYSETEKLLNLKDLSAKLPDPETSGLFEMLVQSLPDNFNYDRFSSVTAFCGLLMLKSQLQVETLSDEISRMENKIADKLAETKNAKSLISVLKDYRLLKKLFALELLPTDFDKLSSASIQPSQIIEKLKSVNGNARTKEITFTNSNELNALYDKAVRFYEGARDRDTQMLRRIEERLSDTGADKVAVVTGGFHAGPFAKYFEGRGYSYALMTPKLTTIDAQGRQNYLDVMQMWASAPKSVTMESGAKIAASTIQPRPATRDLLARLAASVLPSGLLSRLLPRLATGALIVGGSVITPDAVAQAPAVPPAPSGVVVSKLIPPVILPPSDPANKDYSDIRRALETKPSGTSDKAKDVNRTMKLEALAKAKDSPVKYRLLETFATLIQDRREDDSVKFEAWQRLREVFETWVIPSGLVDKTFQWAGAVYADKKNPVSAEVEIDLVKIMQAMLRPDAATSPATRVKIQSLLKSVTDARLAERAIKIKEAEDALKNARTEAFHLHSLALQKLLDIPGITEAEKKQVVDILGNFLNDGGQISRVKKIHDNGYAIGAIRASRSSLAIPHLEKFLQRPGLNANERGAAEAAKTFIISVNRSETRRTYEAAYVQSLFSNVARLDAAITSFVKGQQGEYWSRFVLNPKDEDGVPAIVVENKAGSFADQLMAAAKAAGVADMTLAEFAAYAIANYASFELTTGAYTDAASTVRSESRLTPRQEEFLAKVATAYTGVKAYIVKYVRMAMLSIAQAGDPNFIEVDSKYVADQNHTGEGFSQTEFGSIEKNQDLIDIAKTAHVTVMSLDGGLGEKLRRQDWKKWLIKMGLLDPKSVKMDDKGQPGLGAKGTDMGYLVQLPNGKPYYLSVSESKLINLYRQGQQQRFEGLGFQAIVNGDSIKSYEALFAKPSLIDVMAGVQNPRTYKELLEELNVKIEDFFFQDKVPSLHYEKTNPADEKEQGIPVPSTQADYDKDGKMKEAHAQEAGHGQIGVATVINPEAYKPREDGKPDFFAFTNGDGQVSSNISAQIIGDMIKNNRAIGNLVTAATRVDRKGGKYIVKLLDYFGIKKWLPGQRELAAAKEFKDPQHPKHDPEAEQKFYDAGQPVGEARFGKGSSGKQPFNTNTFYGNRGRLMPFLADLKRVMGEDDYLAQVISPNFMKKDVKKGKDGLDYYPIDAAIGNVYHNINEFVLRMTMVAQAADEGKIQLTDKQRAALEVIRKHQMAEVIHYYNVPRTFFTPQKNPLDAVIQMVGGFFRFNLDTGTLDQTNPNLIPAEFDIKDAQGNPQDSGKGHYSEFLNMLNTFVDTTSIETIQSTQFNVTKLDELKIQGNLSIKETVFIGDVELINESKADDVFDLRAAILASDTLKAAVGYQDNAPLTLENIRIVISEDGSVTTSLPSLSARSEARKPTLAELQSATAGDLENWQVRQMLMGLTQEEINAIPADIVRNSPRHVLETLKILAGHAANGTQPNEPPSDLSNITVDQLQLLQMRQVLGELTREQINEIRGDVISQSPAWVISTLKLRAGQIADEEEVAARSEARSVYQFPGDLEEVDFASLKATLPADQKIYALPLDEANRNRILNDLELLIPGKISGSWKSTAPVYVIAKPVNGALQIAALFQYTNAVVSPVVIFSPEEGLASQRLEKVFTAFPGTSTDVVLVRVNIPLEVAPNSFQLTIPRLPGAVGFKNVEEVFYVVGPDDDKQSTYSTTFVAAPGDENFQYLQQVLQQARDLTVEPGQIPVLAADQPVFATVVSDEEGNVLAILTGRAPKGVRASEYNFAVLPQLNDNLIPLQTSYIDLLRNPVDDRFPRLPNDVTSVRLAAPFNVVVTRDGQLRPSTLELRSVVTPAGIAQDRTLTSYWGRGYVISQPDSEVSIPAVQEPRDLLNVFSLSMVVPATATKPYVIDDADDKPLLWAQTPAGLFWQNLLGRVTPEQREALQARLTSAIQAQGLPLDFRAQDLFPVLQLVVTPENEAAGLIFRGVDGVLKPLAAFSAESQGADLQLGVVDLKADVAFKAVQTDGNLTVEFPQRSETRQFVVVDFKTANERAFVADVLKRDFPDGLTNTRDTRFQLAPFKDAEAFDFTFIPEQGAPFKITLGVRDAFESIESFLIASDSSNPGFLAEHGFLPPEAGRIFARSIQRVEIEPAKVVRTDTLRVAIPAVRSESRLTDEQITVILKEFTGGILTLERAALVLQTNNVDGERIRQIVEEKMGGRLILEQSEGEVSQLDQLLGLVDNAAPNLNATAIQINNKQTGYAPEKGLAIRVADEIRATIKSTPEALAQNLSQLGSGEFLDIVVDDDDQGALLLEIRKALEGKGGIVSKSLREAILSPETGKIRIHERSNLANFVKAQAPNVAVALIMAGFNHELFDGLRDTENVYRLKLAENGKPLNGKNLWAIPVVHVAASRVMANISGIPQAQAEALLQSSFDQVGLRLKPKNADGTYGFGAIETLLQAIVTAKYIAIMA